MLTDLPRISDAGIEPEIVIGRLEDDRHSVVNVLYVECCVSSISDVRLLKEPSFLLVHFDLL